MIPVESHFGDVWDRPIPSPDAVSAPYFRGCTEGKILIQQCQACGNYQFYPRLICKTCGGDPEWRESEGVGEVYTFTIVRQFGMEPFRSEVPYVVGMIRLPEGPLVMGGISNCDVDSVYIGMPVAAYAVRAAEDIGILYWRPITARRDEIE